jgi:hypothetical protein
MKKLMLLVAMMMVGVVACEPKKSDASAEVGGKPLEAVKPAEAAKPLEAVKPAEGEAKPAEGEAKPAEGGAAAPESQPAP